MTKETVGKVAQADENSSPVMTTVRGSSIINSNVQNINTSEKAKLATLKDLKNKE